MQNLMAVGRTHGHSLTLRKKMLPGKSPSSLFVRYTGKVCINLFHGRYLSWHILHRMTGRQFAGTVLSF